MEWTGGSLCGAVRFRAARDPMRVVSCHCGQCRRHSGAAFLTFVHFPVSAFAWIGGTPTRFRSLAEAERCFCPRCGSTLSMHETVLPDRVQVTLGGLDNPGAVSPDDHVWTGTAALAEDRRRPPALPPLQHSGPVTRRRRLTAPGSASSIGRDSNPERHISMARGLARAAF